MDIPRTILVGFRILGVGSILWMAFTGKQYGGRKLHLVYRLMILVTVLGLVLLFYLARHG
jgi:hypothetical protein